MRTKFILAFVVLSFGFECFSQAKTSGVYAGDLTLLTQDEIDSFPLTGITEITGVLTIGDALNTSITSLDSLYKLVAVRTLYLMANKNLLNLKGLHNLRAVQGTLWIGGNESLNNLDNLENLKITKALVIERNQSLKNVDGLKSLTDKISSITIDGNPSLTNLNGFKNVSSLSYLSILRNHALEDLSGLEALMKIESQLTIGNNKGLVSLQGLDNIVEINGKLEVLMNPQLVDFCALKNAFLKSEKGIALQIFSNGYNPTETEISSGKCDK